ncbi:MAG: hypothetical protein DSY32_03580, partial [Aquifex sp.]
MYIYLSSLILSLIGFVWIVRDIWKKVKNLAQKSENPKRAILTYGFLYWSGVILFPLLFPLLFLFFPIPSAFFMAGTVILFQMYPIFKILTLLRRKIKFKNPYEIEPFSDEIKLTKDPEITIKAKAFSKHVHVLASTGAGKTKSVLAPLAKQFIEIGKGIMVIDPKGDNEVAKAFIELLKDWERYPEDFWYFDPMKPKYSLSYNPLYSGIRYGKPEHLAVMVIATMPKVGGTA